MPEAGGRTRGSGLHRYHALVSSRTRKRQKSRHGTRPRPASVTKPVMEDDVADLAESLQQVLEMAFRQAKGLSRSKDPLQGEMVASSLLALWSGLELVGQPDPAAFFARAMTAFLEERATPDALALLLSLDALDAPGTTLERHRAIRSLTEAGVVSPSWRSLAGRARLESAWVSTDPFGDQDFLVGRFSYLGEVAHDVGVLIDHNINDIVKDVGLVLATEDLRGRWEQQPELSTRDISAQEYADRLADGLACLDLTWDPPATQDARMLRPLLEARRIFLPRAKPIKRREVSQAARDRLYAAFRRSEPGRALGRDTQLARLFIDYGSDYYLDGLHWSAIVVELFLTEWLPRKVSLVDDEVERLPGVLRSWLRFVGQERGFEDRFTVEMLDAVDEYAADFRKAMRDASTFGPAKSVAAQMQADGVDFSDPAAVQAWIEAFNARPFEERENLTGGPNLH